MQTLKEIWKAIEGRKTFIAAAFLSMVALTAFFLGRLGGPSTMLVLGSAASLIGLGDKFDRYHQSVQDVLAEMKNKPEAGK